jgi:hypothetical protein
MGFTMIETCNQHGDRTVVSYIGDQCPLCTALDEADELSRKLNQANDDLKGYREVENVNER